MTTAGFLSAIFPAITGLGGVRLGGLLLTLAIIAGAILFILAGRDQSLQLRAQTNILVLTVTRQEHFSFETASAWTRVSADPVSAPDGYRNLSGHLAVNGPTEITMIYNPGDRVLQMIFKVIGTSAPPEIGDVALGPESVVEFDADEMRKIAVMRAFGTLGLGGIPRSNSMSFMESAEFQFFERVPGVGDVITLSGQRGRFDEIAVKDAATGDAFPLDVLIDLSGPGLAVRAEAAKPDSSPLLIVTRLSSGQPVTIAPSVLDRLLANPVGRLITGFFTIVLVLGQILAMLPVRNPVPPAIAKSSSAQVRSDSAPAAGDLSK